MRRYILFKQWYKQLRKEGINMYGVDQSHLDWYARHNKLNCFLWALSNSRTHEIDGSYRKW